MYSEYVAPLGSIWCQEEEEEQVFFFQDKIIDLIDLIDWLIINYYSLKNSWTNTHKKEKKESKWPKKNI